MDDFIGEDVIKKYGLDDQTIAFNALRAATSLPLGKSDIPWKR